MVESQKPLASDSHNLHGAPSAVNRSHSASFTDPLIEQRRESLRRLFGLAIEVAQGAAIALLTLALGLLLAHEARADERGGLITEFGGGIKLPSSSYIAQPACKKVAVVSPEWPANPRPPPQTFACGGDNPMFAGWPLAWEFPNGVTLGWWHQSQWFDGHQWDGSGELHVDCLCATWRVRWSRLRN